MKVKTTYSLIHSVGGLYSINARNYVNLVTHLVSCAHSPIENTKRLHRNGYSR